MLNRIDARPVNVGYGLDVRRGRLKSSAGHYLVAVLDDGLISGPTYSREAYKSVLQSLPLGWNVMAYPGFYRSIVDSHLKIGRIVSLTASTSLGDLGKKALVMSPLQASAYGADAVAVHASFGRADEGDMIISMSSAIQDAHAIGLPVLVAAYARAIDGAPLEDSRAQAHAALCAAELDADLVKVPWPGSRQGLEFVVRAVAPTPVLLAGGAVRENDDLDNFARIALDAGCSGLCVGRRLLASQPERALANLSSVFGVGHAEGDEVCVGLGPSAL